MIRNLLMYLDQYWINLEIEWNGIAWRKSRKLRLRQLSQSLFQLVVRVSPKKTINLYSQWNLLQGKPPRGCKYLVKSTPVVCSAAICIRLHQDFDGDSFDDIFSAYDLELGRNTEQRIDIVATNRDIHDDVLQSLHRWLQHVGEAGPDIPWARD